MVKDNCLSATDEGELCWDSDVKANMLGAYFYGYALQGFVTAVTRHVGFSQIIGFSLIVNTIIQCSFPQSARYSAVLTIALQVVRGVLGGVFLAHNMEFARKWSCGSQGTKFITMVGISLFLGLGFGPMLAGLITTNVGWPYYFYFTGFLYFIVFLAFIFLVPDNPLNSKLMSAKEKNLFLLKEKLREKTEKSSTPSATLCEIFKRLYVWRSVSSWYVLYTRARQYFPSIFITCWKLQQKLSASSNLG